MNATEEAVKITSPIEILRQTERGLRAQLAHLSREADAQSLGALVSAIAYVEEDIRRLSFPAEIQG